MDYFGGLLKEEKVSLIPLIVYFAEQNDRALFIDISSRGLPICHVKTFALATICCVQSLRHLMLLSICKPKDFC